MIPVRKARGDAFARLKTSLMATLPGATEDQISVEMGNAFQAFCRETHVWRERVTRNLLKNVDRYSIGSQETCAVVTFVLAVRAGGRYYRPMGDRAFPSIEGTYEVQSDYSSIRLTPAPAADEPKALEVWIALTLKDDSLDLPDAIIAHYFEMLRDGVLERMLDHPARPYSDPNKAERHRRKFHAGVTRVRREVRGGNAFASAPWHFNQIAPGRNLRGGARTYGL